MIGWLRKIFILLIRKGEKMKEINKKYVILLGIAVAGGLLGLGMSFANKGNPDKKHYFLQHESDFPKMISGVVTKNTSLEKKIAAIRADTATSRVESDSPSQVAKFAVLDEVPPINKNLIHKFPFKKNDWDILLESIDPDFLTGGDIMSQFLMAMESRI